MTSERQGRFPAWATSALGAAAIVALWLLAAWLWRVGVAADPSAPASKADAVPYPQDVVAAALSAGAEYFGRHFGVSLAEAGIGYVVGNALALVFAGVVLVLPAIEGIVVQIATITYCIPIVAMGAVLIVMTPIPDAGEPALTPIVLAGLSVFFTTVVGALLGLKTAERSVLDVITVYGGSRFTQLRKVRLISAVPAILGALQIAVPAAFLGAVLGEFFGKVEAGVGRAMMIAQTNVDAPLVWALALASGIAALAGYGILGLVARGVAPWSKGVSA
ncbi:ABC transporter permease [Microbacterium karelineae]|uniref:ABC transporter permease n=1 Tax=Microbacterium karelineae TaxID=2654283 RepID=UPI0012EA18B3|nr:ABC transporter permease subunit [Microbacterium karelineae]